MLNEHLSYNPCSSCSIIFCTEGYPMKFSCLKKFMALVFPGRGCHKGIILQGILSPTGVLPNVQSWLRIKEDVTGESVHAPLKRNNTYVYTVRWFIYETRRPKHPHLPICHYERRSQGTASRPLYSKVYPYVVDRVKSWTIQYLPLYLPSGRSLLIFVCSVLHSATSLLNSFLPLLVHFSVDTGMFLQKYDKDCIIQIIWIH